MEHIRNVYDKEEAGKKWSCIVSPNEDAKMFRSPESKRSIPCECIVELYELLWRCGHRSTNRPGFAQNYGFAIPDTIVIVKGRPYAWYFISKKDGSLLRKSEANLSMALAEKLLCRDRLEGESPIAATWYPMASQFPEARCHSPHAEFLTPKSCRIFLSSMRGSHSGILQAFVDPHGVSNFLVRTVQYKEQTSLCLRTNRSILSTGRGNPFDRAATFEGWPGLSATSSRYNSHKHPDMEDMILAAGEMLNGRIEQERVRQMLFLDRTEQVALHWKVTNDHQLFFIYASVVQEKDVILQTRPQLLMGDSCMTEALPGSALLPGGTDMKAIPYRGPKPGMPRNEVDEYLQQEESTFQASPSDTEPSGSLPPLRGQNAFQSSDSPPSGSRRRVLSDRSRSQEADIFQYMPRVGYPRPDVPEAPFKIGDPPRRTEADQSVGHQPAPPGPSLGSLKRPLIFPNSAREVLAPLSARSFAQTSRSESDNSGRPPLARGSDLTF
jgi:hypothetical protein